MKKHTFFNNFVNKTTKKRNTNYSGEEKKEEEENYDQIHHNNDGNDGNLDQHANCQRQKKWTTTRKECEKERKKTN